MTDLAYGGEIGSSVPSSGAVYEATAGDGGETIFDSDDSRCAIRMGSSASYEESQTFSGQSEYWGRWLATFENSAFATTVTCFEMLAGSTAQVRVRYSESGSVATLTLQYNNAGTWTTVGSTAAIPIDALTYLDAHLKISTDTLELYASGTLVIFNSGAADLSGLSNITSVRRYGVASASAYASQIIHSTTSTIGSTIRTRYPTGAGNSTAWTGTYADVDEIVYSDTDGISATAANDKELFTHSGADLTGLIMRGVGVSVRAKLGASGATRIVGVLRIGSTDYDHPTPFTLSAGYTAHCFVWELSPATGVAFTAAEVAAMQFGVKALA